MPRLLLLSLVVLAAIPASADEGMWTFNSVPKKRIEQTYGFSPSDEWLRHLQRASVRFNNGGSGSFVSADGLVLTNHHVASDCIQKLSKQSQDLIQAGFLAKTRQEEIACPDLEVNVLESIETVTDRITAAVTAQMTGAEVFKAQREAMAKVEQQCAEETGLRCDVVSLYAGAVFDLYRYQRYTDVRLAFAPEFDIAFFGGDPENFTYPRYDLDMALFRAYDGGAPVHPKDHLSWSDAGPMDGELLFVSGHPGSTSRRLTVAQLELLRSPAMPFQISVAKELLARIKAYSAKGKEQHRIAQKDIFGLENRLKARTGMLSGLEDPALMKKKRQWEEDLKRRSQTLPDVTHVAEAFEEIAQAQKAFAGFYKRFAVLEQPLAFPGQLFSVARTLLRRTEELTKPSEERLREYRESNLRSLDQALFSPAPIYPDLEIEKLTYGFELLRKELGAENALVKSVLGKRSARQAAEYYVRGTKLIDPEMRKTRNAQGVEGVAKSGDTMLELARLVDPEARAVRKRYEEEVDGVEKKDGAAISRAIFALEGRESYPDATFTLRLSFGVAKGYREGGKEIPWATTFAGLYQHATGKPPLKLPESFVSAKDKVDGALSFNFVSTDDIIGGNSGSPAVNKAGELVGLIFDGNLQSLPNAYVYSEERARAVSVSSCAILEALRKVYGAAFLAEEISPKTPPAATPASAAP